MVHSSQSISYIAIATTILVLFKTPQLWRGTHVFCAGRFVWKNYVMMIMPSSRDGRMLFDALAIGVKVMVKVFCYVMVMGVKAMFMDRIE